MKKIVTDPYGHIASIDIIRLARESGYQPDGNMAARLDRERDTARRRLRFQELCRRIAARFGGGLA